MSQHAILSPSGAETWMNCPGSAAMQRGLPDDSNEYSDEGTAAHLLGSTCLELNQDPSYYIGKHIHVGHHPESGWDGAVWWDGLEHPPGLLEIRREYDVDDEMIEAVGRYVDRVRQYAAGAQLLMPEQRISIATFTGEKDAAGTSDAAVVLPGELQVHDLKYGMGVRVSAERNKQLMIYALGVREELELAYGPFERIRFVIHQPRLEHLSEWDCTNAELDAFAEEVKATAAKALKLYNEPMPATIGDNCLALVPSEDACRWCKAKATCPAAAKKITDTLADDFDALSSPDVGAPGVAYPADILAEKMAAISFIEDWCKAIRAEVERQLFAGVAIPGWKIVQGKRGNRSWSNTEAADALLQKMRLRMEERYRMTLLSPTQIEKVLKPTPRRLKRLLDAGLIEQRDGQPSVAPESDKRPAWTPPDTSNDFTAITEGELK